MKKLLALICTMSLLFSAFAEEEKPVLALTEAYMSAYEENAAEAVTMLRPFIENVDSVETLVLPLYLFAETCEAEIELSYLNGIYDIPFIDIRALPELMNLFAEAMEEDDLLYTGISSGPVYSLYRENGSLVLFDFYDGTVSFTDMNRFSMHSAAASPLDLIYLSKEQEEENLFEHQSVFYRTGGVKTISMSDYGIPMLLHGGAGYIPLHTVSDLLFTPWGAAVVYNGLCVIAANANILVAPQMSDLYYAAENGKKSAELTAFTYNELCMALDLFYGLKDEHLISAFDDYFIRTGLVSKLYTADPAVMADGLADLCIMHLCDGHSALDLGSYLMDADMMDIVGGYFAGPQLTRIINQSNYMMARLSHYPDGTPGYEEIGNTAYITFDQFVYDMTMDYYAAEPENDPQDVIELLMYATKQIKRENSPVKNVVLDLTNNMGGMVNVAIAVVSWYLGVFNMSVFETATGATTINAHGFDANADHTIDVSGDSLASDYNLFCLISPNSFSCGNLVPAAFKESGKVTLLGRRSGGGACAVHTLSTADGFMLSISGNYRLSTMNNGIYYSVDEGVAPDIVITSLDHLYDRAYLTQYLNTLP